MNDSQRYFARLKTREQANLTFANGEETACEICDFCQKGLNLQALSRDGGGRFNGEHARGEMVTVEFPGESGGKRHLLHGKLTYSSPTSIGVYLQQLPDDAFHALVDARNKLPHPAGHSKLDLLPEESQAITRDCFNLFQTFVRRAWDELLIFVKGKVADRDASPLPLSDHSRYLNGLTDFIIRAEGLRQQHAALLVKRMQNIADLKENEAPGSGDELTIVDENSFDDWLNVSRMFTRIEGDNKGVMFQFEQRLSRLMRVPVNPHNDPFGPQTVCSTFQEALRELDFNNAMRAALYQQFGDTLHARYGQFLGQLNQLLAVIAPVTPQVDVAPGVRAASRRETVAPSEPQTEANVTERVNQLSDIAERLFSIYTPEEVTPHTAAPAADSGAWGPASQVVNLDAHLQQLQQILKRVSDRLGEGAPTNRPALPAVSGTSGDQIDALLSQLGSADISAAENSLSERVSGLLLHPEFGGQLPDSLRSELDGMARLLSRAMAEHGNQSEIDLLLKKIEKPIYDIVLRGNAPGTLEDHPLGQLINLVDRFAVATDDHGRFHDFNIRELVESILDKGLQNTEVENLTATCEALEKLLKYPIRVRKQRVEGYQEICETKVRLHRCNQFVVDELNGRLAGRVVPKIVTRLFELGWQHRLVLVKLRDDTAEWEQSLRILDQILTAQDFEQPEDRRNLLDAIESRLQAVVMDSSQRDELMTGLAAYLNAPGQTERVQIPESWFRLADGSNEAAERNALAEQLRIGDWWDIEHDRKPVPMQLIWLSSPAGRMCFVNRSADRKQDLTLSELATLADAGQARPGEDCDLPLLERSEYGAIDAMYRHLVQQAHHDPVTNLPNRKYLLHRIQQVAHFDSLNSFCALSFDPYQTIFDHCGIEAGETLTRSLASIATSVLEANQQLSVVGEGTFAIFLPGTTTAEASEFAARLCERFEDFRFQHAGEDFAIHVFFGIAPYQVGTTEAGEALRQAVSASQAARSIGPGTVQVYADSDGLIQARENAEGWAGQISDMLAGDRLFLRCQKVSPIQDANVLPYYEVLLGVRDKDGRQIGPQQFVLAVERWQRAHELDLWVFTEVFAWIRRNPTHFGRIGGFSINLSAQSLSNSNLLATLHRELSAGDIACDKIIFEITETATLQSHAVAQDFIRQIHRYGCRFSLDDFGSGNASFGYLRSLRTDTLKIDGAYVKDMVGDPGLQAMVRSMNDIGHSLGMKTVAEFVSNSDLLALVAEMGIDYAQGFEVEKPIHINDLLAETEVVSPLG